jgi:hypothetical protein
MGVAYLATLAAVQKIQAAVVAKWADGAMRMEIALKGV